MADTELQQLAKTDRNPVQETRYRELLRQQETSQPFGNYATSATPDLAALARQQLQLRQEANAPAVASLEAGIPETSARFATERTRLAGEKEPLKQRYQSILDEITRREKVDVGAQERVTSREFGRRGIPLSSGLFDTTLQEAVSPLSQFYTGQAKEAGL
ncbi:MAG: hypothetical protein HYS80_02590, partial [Candidatus Aenigmarchaeota archaeon]|nr:hypothetical protein [Candidatus Aenigmarchaeota archaeon]